MAQSVSVDNGVKPAEPEYEAAAGEPPPVSAADVKSYDA